MTLANVRVEYEYTVFAKKANVYFPLFFLQYLLSNGDHRVVLCPRTGPDGRRPAGVGRFLPAGPSLNTAGGLNDLSLLGRTRDNKCADRRVCVCVRSVVLPPPLRC